MNNPQALAEQIAEQILTRLRSNEPLTQEYLTPEDASVVTGISVRQLEALRATRKGPPYFKLGNSKCSRVRYRLADLRTWIERGGPVE